MPLPTVFFLDGEETSLDTLCKKEPEWAANRIRQLTKQVDDLCKDKQRLDYLDECNRRLNAYCNSTYGWKLVHSHLVNRLMFKDLDRSCGGVDLSDATAHGFDSCRDAIDEKMEQL